MSWLRRLWAGWQGWRREIEEPFDADFPGDSDYYDSTPPIPAGFEPCDTQPTSPGLLDTLPGRLK